MHTDDRVFNPTVSVIIPTLNAGPDLQVLLLRLWDQTLRPSEIIVVDSSSKDGTADLARKLGVKVYSIDQADYDHGGTRNYAASLASGNIFVFMTQDAIPFDNELLSQLVGPLEDPTVGCSYARQIAKPGANLLEQLSRDYNYPQQSKIKNLDDIPQMGIKTFFCSNVCSAISRKTFKELGQFTSPVIFNEDLFFAAKCIMAGYSVAYAADAMVLHSHNYSLGQQFKRLFDNGVSMRMNEWILPYSSVNRAGSKLIHYQLREVAARKSWHWIPVIMAEALAKYAGFQLGKHYRRLPNFLCKRFSMHRKIWDKLHSSMNRGSGLQG